MLIAAVVGLALTVSAPLSQAANGWTYKVLADSGLIDDHNMVINNLGEVAYTVLDSTLTRKSIRISNGVTSRTVFEGAASGFNVVRIGLNDAGDVTYYGTLPGQPGPYSLYRIVNGAAVPIPVSGMTVQQATADLNNSGQTAFWGNTGAGATLDAIRIAITDSQNNQKSMPIFDAAAAGPGAYSATGGPYAVVLNDRADLAAAAFDVLNIRGSLRYQLRLRLWLTDTNEVDDYVLALGSGSAFWSDIGLNNRRFASAIISEGSVPSNRRAVATVPFDYAGEDGGLFIAARVGTGPGDFSTLLPGSSINDTNYMAFGGTRPGAQAPGIYLRGLRLSEPVVPVFEFGDVIEAGGGPGILSGDSTSASIHTQSLNNSGQMVFRIRRGTVTNLVIASPEPGLLASNPILPAPPDFLNPPPGFRINLCNRLQRQRCFIDPPVSSGFTYEAQQGTPNFESVMVPVPLPGGDADFTLEFEGHSVAIKAGDAYYFTDLVPAGVKTFRLTGIDVAEALDPDDAAAFVTGLTFMGPTTSQNSVTMVPIVVNTDPPLPTVAAEVTGTLGTNGWYTGNVSVSWAIDAHGLEVTSSTGCSSATVTADTAAQTFTCTVATAGGTASASTTIKRDATIPDAAVTSPSSGASFAVGASVASAYSCSDSPSGIAQCVGTVANGAAIDTATAGTKNFSVVATDLAGNTRTVTSTYTVTGSTADVTPPVIQPTVAGTLGTNGWYVSNATVTWQVQDAESTISSRSGCDAKTVSSDTAGVTFTCKATSAGGSTTRSVTVKRDATAPTVVILSPLPLDRYPKNIRLPALYTCVDLRSGVDTCSGSVALGAWIDTASVGTKRFTLEARDKAGNRVTRTVEYQVR